MKLAMAAIVVLLVAKNRKFQSIPKGLWGLITALTLARRRRRRALGLGGGAACG